MSVIGVILDIAVLAALGGAIFYALRLSSQIKQMQADRQAFEILIESLTQAATRAETAVRSLRETAAASGDNLETKIKTARGLFEELEIMIEAGDNLANRLEDLAARSRRATAHLRGEEEEPPALKKAAGFETFTGSAETQTDMPPVPSAPKSRAEKDLIAALRAKHK